MSRDVGTFNETKSVIDMIESREAGHDQMGPTGSLKTPYAGGKTSPTLGSFAEPGMGKVRKGME